jgi:ribosomal protein L34E
VDVRQERRAKKRNACSRHANVIGGMRESRFAGLANVAKQQSARNRHGGRDYSEFTCPRPALGLISAEEMRQMGRQR